MRFHRLSWLILVVALAETALSQNSAQLHLVGVGTTTPLPIFSKWFQAFQKARPDVHLTYMPYGSGAGIEMVTSGKADFGSTDAPLSDRQLAKARVLQFPVLLGAIVPIYNLPKVPQLKFSPRALAGIYLGTVTKWNDPFIAAANPEVLLPPSDIAVVHSAGGRGSTYVWSEYLSKIDVRWRTRVGRGISVRWPVGTEGDGYADIARIVKDTPNSIGYVELAFAVQNGLAFGKVRNAAGNFISPDSASLTAAAAAGAKAIPCDLRAALTNPHGDNVYPISSYTWILISKTESATKRQALKEFLRWVLNQGQDYVEPAGFARLPPPVVEQEQKQIEGEIP